MLVGFIGKMGSGKTTSADYLVENYKFTKLNFKDALDEELLELYPNVLTHFACMYGADSAEEILTRKPTQEHIRELKQKHGTDVRRNQDPDYWVKKWIHKYQTMFNQNVCVDDVRFLNEVDAIKRFGGVIVRIQRSDITDTGDHPSETALDEYEADITISADKGDHMMVYMSLDNLVDNDLGREEDSDPGSESHTLTEGSN